MSAPLARPARVLPLSTALAALGAAALLLGCSADVDPLPADASALEVVVEGPGNTCQAPDGTATLDLIDLPVRLVEDSGTAQPADRIEVRGTVDGFSTIDGDMVLAIALDPGAPCAIVDVRNTGVQLDGPFTARFPPMDGLRIFSIVTNAPIGNVTCVGDCIDVGGGTLSAVSDAVVVDLQ